MNRKSQGRKILQILFYLAQWMHWVIYLKIPAKWSLQTKKLFLSVLHSLFLAETGSTSLQLYQEQYTVTGLTEAKTWLRNLCDSKFEVLFSQRNAFASKIQHITHVTTRHTLMMICWKDASLKAWFYWDLQDAAAFFFVHGTKYPFKCPYALTLSTFEVLTSS